MSWRVAAVLLFACAASGPPPEPAQSGSGVERAPEAPTAAASGGDEAATEEADGLEDQVEGSAAGSPRGSAATPLPAEVRARIARLPAERIPTPGEYYYRSNELRHDLLADDLRGLGGVVLGVGPDQIYTLAAMARAELIVGVDYDWRIPALHRLYRVLVPRSDTAADLLGYFAPEAQEQTLALLRAELGDDSQPIRMFERLHDDLHAYLQRQARRRPNDVPATWLSDDGHYAHVRDLFRAGRVFARTGDLTGETTVRAIGALLRDLGWVVRVFYVSNADQFFEYDEAFVANARALPTDERSVIVRSIRHPRLPNAEDDRWHYIVQELPDLMERLDERYFRRSQVVVEELIDAGPPWVGGDGLSHITRQTPRSLLEHRRRRRAATD